MRKTPSTPIDRTSQTFNDAKEILGSGPNPATPTPQGVHNIDVDPTDNGGFVVSHSMKKKPEKGNEWDTSGPRQKNAFGSAADAHAHIGTLMGVKPHNPGSKGGGLG